MFIGTPTIFFTGSGASIASGVATAATGNAVAAGQLLVCFVYGQSNGTIGGLTDTAGNTYHKAIQQLGSSHDCEIWYCINANAILTSTTFTATSSPANYFLWAAVSISGCNGGLDQTAGTEVTNTTFSLSTAAGTVASKMAVGFAVPSAFTTYTEDATWTKLGASGGSPAVVYSYKAFSVSTVTWNPTWTVSNVVDAAIATFEATPDVTVNAIVTVNTAFL
jgi:hypothetical protein